MSELPVRRSDMSVPESVALTVGAVARRLGVAPATLRTWDRRYGLGPSAHEAGAHRRYSPEDVARLDVMHRLTFEGVAPADAARAALAAVAGTHEGTAPPATVTGISTSSASLSLGFHGSSAATRGLFRAALALDAARVRDIVQASLLKRGVTTTWDHLLVPVFTAVGDRWEATGAGVEVEHLLSEAVQVALGSTVSKARHPINARPVLLASAEDELHSLPLHALAAALAERQVSVRVLGARVPREALNAAVRKSGPAAVFVWSQDHRTGDASPLAHLTTVRPAPAVLAGGPGWSDPLPPQVQRVSDLSEAVVGVLRAVGS